MFMASKKLLRLYVQRVLKEYSMDAEGTEYNDEYFQSFIQFAKNEIGIEELPNIKVVSDFNGTTGAYQYEEEPKQIIVRGGGRALVDILRSITHELVHHKQKEEGKIKKDNGDGVGGKLEDDASAGASEIIKMWGMQHQGVYKE